MGLWGSLVIRLRIRAARALMPADARFLPNSIETRPIISPSTQTGIHHEIRTDISGRSHSTIFAGILNLRPNGTTQSAFRQSYAHAPTPLKIGAESMLIPADNFVLSEAYATYMAVALWAPLLRGGIVTCRGDNRDTVVLLNWAQGKAPPPGKALVSHQGRVGRAIVAEMKSIAAENQFELRIERISGKENLAAHKLSRCQSGEEVVRLGRGMSSQVDESARRFEGLSRVGLLGQLSLWQRFRREVALLREEARLAEERSA